MATTDEESEKEELEADEVYCTSCGEVIKEEAEICPNCGVRQKEPSESSSSSEGIVDPSAFRHRSLGMQVIFSILTLGLYTIYWYHITHKQLANGTSADFSPGMRTIGLFIPIYNLVVMWRTGHDAEAITDQSGPILFLFQLVFPPAFWYLVQSGFNKIAQA